MGYADSGSGFLVTERKEASRHNELAVGDNSVHTPKRGRDIFASNARAISLAENATSKLPRRARESILRSCRGDSLASRALRYVLLRSLALECGELVDVRGDVHLRGVGALRLGSRISIHPFGYLDASGSITIGDDVSIAHGVTVMSTEHRYEDRHAPIRDQGVVHRPVVIESNVWLGAGVKVLAGVTVGTGSVVGAGAVVVRDIPPNSVAVGVPAKAIRARSGNR